MKIILRLAAAALLAICFGSAEAAPDPDGRTSVEIQWSPKSGSPDDALWLAYLKARAAYINGNTAAYDWKPGVITPSFAEELAARSAVAQIYHELKQKDALLNLAYFEDLARVADKSYLGEYVWTYLHQPEWASPPDNLHLVDFMQWRATNLAQHAVMTRGSIRFSTNGAAPAEPARAAPSEVPLLLRGKAIMQHGDPRLAIAGYFDPAIEHFERVYRDPGKRVYAARNQVQALLYVALPNDDKKPVEVVDSTWSDAYLMKAYAHTELREFSKAQAALESAIALSPMTAQYHAELAYLYQAQGQCDRSIATYEEAATVAEIGSDDSTRTADLTLAWRGQGYCLVEQGRLDEAEKFYRKCLALDPSDKKAKGELEYIKTKRR